MPTGKMTLGLFDPGMTDLHKVGLAGLYIGLSALNQDEFSAMGGWQLFPDSVELSWNDNPAPFFEKIFSQVFKIKDGRIALNRVWKDAENDHSFNDLNFEAWHPTNPKGDTFWDDDVLGFMDASASSEESELQHEIPKRLAELTKELEKKPQDARLKKKKEDFEQDIEKLKELRTKSSLAGEQGNDEEESKLEKDIQKLRKKLGLKGGAIVRRGVLEVARAISTLPFVGDISFNAKSGKKGRTSLYGTEMHATRYQYGFAMTPERLRVKTRCLDVLDAIAGLGEVAGNQSRFLFDFSPESIVLRVTHDPAPRILYCFDEIDNKISVPELLRKIDAHDIKEAECFIGGAIAKSPDLKSRFNGQIFEGVMEAVLKAKLKICSDLISIANEEEKRLLEEVKKQLNP